MKIQKWAVRFGWSGLIITARWEDLPCPLQPLSAFFYIVGLVIGCFMLYFFWELWDNSDMVFVDHVDLGSGAFFSAAVVLIVPAIMSISCYGPHTVLSLVAAMVLIISLGLAVVASIYRALPSRNKPEDELGSASSLLLYLRMCRFPGGVHFERVCEEFASCRQTLYACLGLCETTHHLRLCHHCGCDNYFGHQSRHRGTRYPVSRGGHSTDRAGLCNQLGT